VPNRPQGGWIYTGSTHIPEIHGVTFALGHVSGNKRLFLPVRTDSEVNKKRNRVFVEIGYGKKNEGGVQISRFYKGDKSSNNPEFVHMVAEKNIRLTIEDIRTRSPILKEMEDAGKIKIVGAMYDMNTGEVEFLE
jgi:hypothetical protein